MEQIYDITHARQTVSGFTAMSQSELNTLISQLELRMSGRDLHYCQNQYRMRERRNPTVEELRFLDTLYCHRTHRIEYYGLRSFYTSDSLLAQTYADMIAKATHMRHDDRPFTPAQLSTVLTKSLVQAGKKISVPSLYVGKNAAIRSLKQGQTEAGCAVIQDIPAVIGQPCEKLSAHSAAQQSSDHILLLSPAGLSPAAFAQIIIELPIPPKAQIVTIGENGLLDALLQWDGVYLVQNYLPGMNSDTPLAELVSVYSDSLLLRIDGEAALPLRDAAAAAGLIASIIGKCTLNHQLTIRREEQAPLQFEIAFLKAFAPTLPADAEIPGSSLQEQMPASESPSQTVIGGGDCALFASALPDTPYVIQHDHLLTGASSHHTADTFRSTMLATFYAVNRAVAAGANYESLTLSNHLTVPQRNNPNFAVGELMAAVLGIYRAQAELALPDVGGQLVPSTADTSQATLTVFAATQKPAKVIPHTFTSPGNNVYLLAPMKAPQSPVDFDDYRKLLRYVHHLCEEGIARSAIAVDSAGVEAALRTMTRSGYGFLTTSTLPQANCAFLIESTEVIQGTLIGVTTATPMICIGTDEIPVKTSLTLKLSPEEIPMSDIGVSHPVICIPQTPALGSTLPLAELAQKHNAFLRTVPLNKLSSRTQLTALANEIITSQIAVLVGSSSEIETILSHRRIAYAKDEMLKRGGLLLCLHTDAKRVKNALIPTNHPLFFAVPASQYDRCGIRFDSENDHLVHMCCPSPAIPQMLIGAIAYFQ